MNMHRDDLRGRRVVSQRARLKKHFEMRKRTVGSAQACQHRQEPRIVQHEIQCRLSACHVEAFEQQDIS